MRQIAFLPNLLLLSVSANSNFPLLLIFSTGHHLFLICNILFIIINNHWSWLVLFPHFTNLMHAAYKVQYQLPLEFGARS